MPAEERARYAALCDSEPSLGIFQQAWWLDATCGSGGWDVGLVEAGGQIQAALPYRDRRKFGIRVLSQPPLTPFLGPWLRPTGGKPAARYARDKELMTGLIDALPRHDVYTQTWSPALTNWLPFHWKGFKQTTLYTYAIEDLGDEGRLWLDLRENIRREIKKARTRFSITIVEGGIDDMLALNRATFSRQDLAVPYSDDYLRTIDRVCAQRTCRKILVARDDAGIAHAAAFVVWDRSSAYYLVGGGDPKLRQSGAMSLCLWEAIRFAATVTRRFDFEGSMIEPIERFVRSFGAVQVAYFRVTRGRSRLLKTALAIKGL